MNTECVMKTPMTSFLVYYPYNQVAFVFPREKTEKKEGKGSRLASARFPLLAKLPFHVPFASSLIARLLASKDYPFFFFFARLHYVYKNFERSKNKTRINFEKKILP